MARLAEITALVSGFGAEAARQIKTATLLHDIGKLKIPEGILNKPGKLDVLEFEIVKTHTKLGAEMLRSLHGEIKTVAQNIAMFHHERHDGNGYWRKRTSDLPPYLPIAILADVYVALISERPYKRPWTTEKAVDYIRKNAGTQFDPDMAEVFISLIVTDSRVAAIFI